MIKKRAMPFIGPGSNWSVITRAPLERPPVHQTLMYSAKAFAPAYLQGSEVLTSESHPEWHRRQKSKDFSRAPQDIGGPFSVVKQYATLAGGCASFSVTEPLYWPQSSQTVVYNGMCLPRTGNITFPPFARSSKGALDAAGTSMISQCKPTNVFEDMSASLGELAREGLPKLGVQAWKDVTQSLKNVASGHLAIEFGFKPILSDIHKVLLARERTRTVIEQYIRDSGKLVRRRLEYPVQKSEEFSIINEGISAMPMLSYSTGAIDNLFGTSGKTVRRRETSVRRWFSGAFMYHLPIDNLKMISADTLRQRGLISFNATPETIWNLAPWSWAVDWVLPVGDLIGNLQDYSTDGLVLKYGYVMEHSIVRDTYTYIGKGSQYCGSLTLTSECKQRNHASPFGFGIDWNGLSPRQLSIVAALGITRS
jgi:hypothetical protein